jgi:hypothetical protein
MTYPQTNSALHQQADEERPFCAGVGTAAASLLPIAHTFRSPHGFARAHARARYIGPKLAGLARHDPRAKRSASGLGFLAAKLVRTVEQ